MLRSAVWGAILLALVLSSAASAADKAGQARDEYVVVFKDGTNAKAKANADNVSPDFVYRYALSGFAARLNAKQQARLAADPDTLMLVPDDPEPASASAGAMRRQPTPIEQSPQQVARGIRRIGTLASRTAKIDGIDERVDVDVAVLDSGVDKRQPDLNVVGGTGCNGGAFDDQHGHGTMVAGVIGALDNGFGVVGVAPGARIWSVHVLDSTLSATTMNILCGVDWVAQHADVIDVANLSLIGPGADDGACGLVNRDPLHWAICHAVAAGVTFVAGAGNDSADASSFEPASFSEVITASGLSDTDGMPGGLGPAGCDGEADDVFASFSNFGSVVDLAAPAACIGSTFPNGGLALGSGTSYAAPHVAGAAALYLARHPHASPRQVRNELLDAREQTALPGDPDGIAEGVVNVSGF